nr:MAG TPA: hypothetical protein [Caudoviricetes sp.]
MGSPYDNIVSKNGGNVKRKDNVLFLHIKNPGTKRFPGFDVLIFDISV